MEDSEDDLEDNAEIGETYRLNETKLPEIIQKINSDGDGCPIYLTEEGIRISRHSNKEKDLVKRIDIGRLIVGVNIDARNSKGLYLQTYEYGGKRGEPDLVNLLREYIA